MQGLSDGYFVIPYTLGQYIAGESLQPVGTDGDAFKEAENASSERLNTLLSINGNKTVLQFHKELGRLVWDLCRACPEEQGRILSRPLLT